MELLKGTRWIVVRAGLAVWPLGSLLETARIGSANFESGLVLPQAGRLIPKIVLSVRCRFSAKACI